MDLIQISNMSSKSVGARRTIRFTQSICPDCNMILDAEVFEREGFHDQDLPDARRVRGIILWLL